MKFIFLVLLVVLVQSSWADLANYDYHNYVQLTNFMNSLASMYPDKAYLYSIGQTVEGRQLWVMAIADKNPQSHVVLRPEAKLIGIKKNR